MYKQVEAIERLKNRLMDEWFTGLQQVIKMDLKVKGQKKMINHNIALTKDTLATPNHHLNSAMHLY